ncbi:MAG: ATP-binding protein [Chloroherpetonaceae bacterium]|nr:ATP-binding protein [Chloroherpetonaceae bacterium]
MIKQTLHRLKRNEVQLALFAFLSCVSGAAIVVLTLTSLDLSKEADIAFAVLGGFVIGSIIATVVYRIVKRNRELAESLQKVTESLNEANSQLQFYNESLTETVKKRTEELLFAELQYRSLFDSTAELIFICGPDYRVMEVNRAVETFFGWDRNSLQEFNLLRQLSPENADRFIKAAQRTERGELVREEIAMSDLAGETHIFQAEFSPLIFGTTPVAGGFKVLMQDITLEKRSRLEREVIIKISEIINQSETVPEIARRISKELGELFEPALLLIYRYDEPTNMLFLEYEASDDLPESVRSYPLKEQAKGIAPLVAMKRQESFIEEALKEPRLQYAEKHLLSIAARSVFTVPLIGYEQLQGVLQIITLRQRRFSEDDKRLARILATELAEGLYRKKLSEALAEANKTLAEKNAELEQFVYSVSHDLKAPLISIQGFAARVQELYYDKMEYEARFALERIRYNAKVMEDMITELLDLSRVGRETVKMDEIYLYEMVSTIMENYRGHLEAQRVKVNISPDLPLVKFPRRRLEQVMTNLVGNAIRYTAKVKDPCISIYAIDHPDTHEIVVKDNGIGIAPKDFEKVFRLFERGESDQPGSGVGLAIVKKVVEQYGGKIWIQSELGKGAEFHFTIKKRA